MVQAHGAQIIGFDFVRLRHRSQTCSSISCAREGRWRRPLASARFTAAAPPNPAAASLCGRVTERDALERIIPPRGQPHRAHDDAHHAVGLRKVPHSSPLTGSKYSDRRPKRLRRASSRSNSSRARWRSPISASACTHQKAQTTKAVSGRPKSSARSKRSRKSPRRNCLSTACTVARRRGSSRGRARPCAELSSGRARRLYLRACRGRPARQLQKTAASPRQRDCSSAPQRPCPRTMTAAPLPSSDPRRADARS